MIVSVMSLAHNIFTNIPTEFKIPSKTKVVFVTDLFATDLTGGAELTTQALIAANNNIPLFPVHSSSLTLSMLKKNKDKHFVLCNFTRMYPEVLEAISNPGDYEYSIVEYDFKYCCFRSENRHLMETQQVCNCYSTQHGERMAKLFLNAKARFWMSQKQKDLFIKRLPNITSQEKIQFSLRCFCQKP